MNEEKIIKKVVQTGKKVKKATDIGKIIKKGTKASLKVIDSVNTKPTNKMMENLERLEASVEKQTEGFHLYLNHLQKKFDASIGDKLDTKLADIEQWIQEHGGEQAEAYLKANSALLQAKFGKKFVKHLIKLIKKKSTSS